MEKETIIDFTNPDYFFIIDVKNQKRTLTKKFLWQFLTEKNDILEIDANWGQIDDIECISCETAEEKKLDYPELDTLRNRPVFSYYPEFVDEDNYINNFNIIYSKEDMSIVFDEDFNRINSYHKDGRFIYYTDNNEKLVALRVTDITPEEYEAIQRKKNLFPSVSAMK